MTNKVDTPGDAPNQAELLAQIDAAYDIERARNDGVRVIAVMLGDKLARDYWRLAFNQGRSAGLQLAKEIISAK